jgi:hypothetical protein
MQWKRAGSSSEVGFIANYKEPDENGAALREGKRKQFCRSGWLNGGNAYG